MTNFSRSWKHDQVFISFRGKPLRKNFVSHLKEELKRSKINFFIDEDETRGRRIATLFETIRESGVALILLSNKYSDSEWCLDELVEIKKQMETGYLDAFPVFYEVKSASIKSQTGCFGNTLLKTENKVRRKVDRGSYKSILETEARIWGWRQALVYIEKSLMHPQEALTSLLQALNIKKSDLEDLITRPFIQTRGTDHLVFLDLISLKNPILGQRLIKRVQDGMIFLVLLGSVDGSVEDVDFKPRLLSRKPRLFPGNKLIVSPQEIEEQRYFSPVQVSTECADVLAMAESNENTRNRLGVDKNSDCSLTCFSLLCNIMKRFEMMINPPPPRVFISFGEKQLEMNLVSSLKTEFESNEISVYIEDETKERIKESKVAIVVFSDKYPESPECLDELVEIKKLMDVGEITPFPIFYKLKDVPRLAQSVKQLKGCFRNRLLKIEQEVRKTVNRDNVNSILDTEARIWEWRQAISSISLRPGLSNENSSDPVFFTDVVTKVKELFEFKAIPKKSSSYIITNQVIEEKPIMHRQKTAPAIPTVKSLDDDLFYSLPSFLQALDLEITDLEGFTEMHSGLISLSLKRHNNLVCLNLGSLEKLVHFRCSDSFEFLSQGFGLNHPGISRFEEPSRVLVIESSQPQQRFDNVLSSHLKIANIT
ncbi:unnamed protein product [Brassica rapa]|uniref:TIR domain-containing protein n=1 Tax=Brassica campestris TaxID=3711 RepID=A0A3P5Z4W6_BRACM|nr:unnamed protein product [Brassica rapa]VDC74912.1 unnamed protein product [Brassica rapa]